MHPSLRCPPLNAPGNPKERRRPLHSRCYSAFASISGVSVPRRRAASCVQNGRSSFHTAAPTACRRPRRKRTSPWDDARLPPYAQSGASQRGRCDGNARWQCVARVKRVDSPQGTLHFGQPNDLTCCGLCNQGDRASGWASVESGPHTAMPTTPVVRWRAAAV